MILMYCVPDHCIYESDQCDFFASDYFGYFESG